MPKRDLPNFNKGERLWNSDNFIGNSLWKHLSVYLFTICWTVLNQYFEIANYKANLVNVGEYVLKHTPFNLITYIFLLIMA